MRISDWSSDVCSSDLVREGHADTRRAERRPDHVPIDEAPRRLPRLLPRARRRGDGTGGQRRKDQSPQGVDRSEEHTSELQSLMRTSYAVFCLKKKTTTKSTHNINEIQRQNNTNTAQ